MKREKLFKPMKCPVCHDFYFSELTEDDIKYGLAQQCTQCGWKYNLEQVKDPDLVDIQNGMSLKEYKKQYRKKIAKNPNYNYLEANYTPRPHLCPVCGKHTFPDEGSFDICPECGWEDDGVMEDHPDGFEGNGNDLCLNDFRKRYEDLIKKNPHYRYKRDGIPEVE